MDARPLVMGADAVSVEVEATSVRFSALRLEGTVVSVAGYSSAFML